MDLAAPRVLRRILAAPTAYAAALVNLAPALGVVGLGWDAGTVIVLYWLENLVIGAYAIARMVASGLARGRAGVLVSCFAVPFFCVHFGGFCMIHGLFVVGLFGNSNFQLIDFNVVHLARQVIAVTPGGAVAVAVLAAWHGYRFGAGYLATGAATRANPLEEMAAPYGRIMLTHFGLFAAGFALFALGEPLIGVVALVGLKAAAETWFELKDLKASAGPATNMRA